MSFTLEVKIDLIFAEYADDAVFDDCRVVLCVETGSEVDHPHLIDLEGLLSGIRDEAEFGKAKRVAALQRLLVAVNEVLEREEGSEST